MTVAQSRDGVGVRALNAIYDPLEVFYGAT